MAPFVVILIARCARSGRAYASGQNIINQERLVYLFPLKKTFNVSFHRVAGSQIQSRPLRSGQPFYHHCISSKYLSHSVITASIFALGVGFGVSGAFRHNKLVLNARERPLTEWHHSLLTETAGCGAGWGPFYARLSLLKESAIVAFESQ